MEPEVRKAHIERLSSPDEEERRLAMEALKGDLSEADLEWLTAPLSDESWRVRKESIEGLSGLSPTPELIAALVPLMDPENELTLRNSVVEVLERIGPEAADPLLEYLDIDQADVRKFLVDILGHIAHPDTVPSLLSMLSDPEDNIKAAAAEALAAIGDASVCDGLISAMEGANEWFIYSLMGSLARLRCKKALPLFFDYLGNQLLSKPAMSGIGVMGSAEDGVRLAEMVKDLSKGSSKSACMACGTIFRRCMSGGDKEGGILIRDALSRVMSEEMVDALISQLAIADDLDDRKDILAALGMSGSSQAIDAILSLVEDDSFTWDVDLALLTLGERAPEFIIGLLDHHDPLVRQRAVNTVERMGGSDYLEDLYRMLEDEGGHVRKEAATAIASLGHSDSMAKLLPMLEDEYSDVAHSAARALVHLGRKATEDLAAMIAPMLENAAVELYTLLIMILAEVGAPEWEDLCFKAAQSTEPGIRAVAVSCLKHSGQKTAIDTIINSLADEDAQVRGQAAVTLEELKHPEAIAPLKAILHDPDPWVRSAAVSSLSAQPAADPEDFRELLDGDDLMMQTSALDALGRLAESGNAGALEILHDQFMTGTIEIKRSVCRLLGKIDSPRALDLLMEALEDDDGSIRVFAVHSLAERSEAFIPGTLSDLGEKDPDKQVREAVRAVLEGRS